MRAGNSPWFAGTWQRWRQWRRNRPHGSQNAASYQLATGEPVMAIGGFNGTDPSPTLAQFREYVEEGRVHYFLANGDEGGGRGGGGMPGRGGTSSEISSWVGSRFTKVTVDGATFYDLTRPKPT